MPATKGSPRSRSHGEKAKRGSSGPASARRSGGGAEKSGDDAGKQAEEYFKGLRVEELKEALSRGVPRKGKLTNTLIQHAVLRHVHDPQRDGESDEEYADRLCKDFEVVRSIVTLILDLIRSTLIKGRPVALFNIGTLRPYLKKGSRYRHPLTGKQGRSPDRAHLKLVISPNMRDLLRSVDAKVLAKLKG